MLGYYKRHIIQLSMHLQELRSHPDDLQLLVTLQLEILARIILDFGHSEEAGG
jgi:hypothetical protein